jgi:hypothetical protein
VRTGELGARMTRSFTTQLAGQIGESLVVAELGRRGIVATAFAGNVPDIDLLAYMGGKTLHLQVKAWRAGAVSFNATRFLNIRREESVQIVEGLVEGLDAELVYVFVRIGEAAGQDRFFVLRQGDLAEIIRANYDHFLSKHSGVRPRNADTTHVAVSEADLAQFEGNWQIVDACFAA